MFRPKFSSHLVLHLSTFCLIFLAQNVKPLTASSETKEEIIVTTPLGQLRGQILESRGGQGYAAFVGIPFAEKTARFETAKPSQPWEGIRDALNPGPVCPQIIVNGRVSGSEDCLYVNVFHPTAERCQSEDDPDKLPVLFYIHGGGWISGWGDLYTPDYLMDECVVYVSTNYRVGALGFLTTEDGLIPGNLGLKDQLLALKWTNEHIGHFRGNQDSITIQGQSGGGMSVSHMITSPAAKGLFTRAIAQSGSVLNGYAIIQNPGEKAALLGSLLNCTGTSSAELKTCFLAASVEDIVSYQEQGKVWFKDPQTWGPVIELPSAVYPFQTREPLELLKEGEFNQVPLITGIVLDEGILVEAGEIMLNPIAVNDLNTNWNKYAPFTFGYDELNLPEEVLNRNSEAIRNFYLVNESISDATFQNFVNVYSDRYFSYGIFRNVELHSKFAPAYHYVFTFLGNFSFAMANLGYTEPVVTHSDENLYLFNFPSMPTPEGEGLEMSKNFVKLWTSFVKYGEPLGTWTDGVNWTAYNGTDIDGGRVTLKLDTQMETLTNYLGERIHFWDDLELTQLEYP